MSATYDPTLAQDLDWVRLLAGDRDTVNPRLSDEEILGILSEEPNKYFAAAVACESILAKSGGAVDKQVGDLRIKWSDSPKSAYNQYVTSLRERGAYELNKKNYILKVL